MSLTITRERGSAYSVAGRAYNPITITPAAVYPAGGYTLDPSIFGQKQGSVEGVISQGIATAFAGQFSLQWDSVNSKLRVFRGSAVRAYAPGGGDIDGATNVVAANATADMNAAPVNHTLLLAAATFTSLAGTMTPTAQPDVPRNIVITVTNDSGGALDMFEGVTSFLITGTDVRGVAQTETVTVTSTAGNKSVADTKFRAVQSAKAFATVTSVAITNAPAATLKGSLGVGSRIGLPTALATPLHTDVSALTVNNARVATSATAADAGGVDIVNNTVNVGTIANGDDVGIVYKDTGEVGVGEDISAASFVALVITS